MLPQLDGFEVCRILRKDMNVPILMLTVKDEEVDFRRIRWRIAALYVPLVIISTALAALFSANSLATALIVGSATLLGVTFNRMVQSIKERTDELAEQRSRLATALSGMADGVVMTDADGTVLLANPAAERLFGFEEARTKGFPFIEVIPDHEISELLQSCMKEGVQKAGQIERNSGQLFLRVVATPFRSPSQYY